MIRVSPSDGVLSFCVNRRNCKVLAKVNGIKVYYHRNEFCFVQPAREKNQPKMITSDLHPFESFEFHYWICICLLQYSGWTSSVTWYRLMS